MFLLLGASFGGTSCGQPAAPIPEEISSSLIKDAAVVRVGHTLLITPDAQAASAELHIPRFAAALRRMSWGGKTAGSITLTPEQDHWVIKWKDRPTTAELIRLDFDQRPLLVEEIAPTQAAGDGSVLLHAHRAKTLGEKIRFEPQMHKNTVGYWTGKQDQASWQLEVKKAGKYNLAILQGCGQGQGGSIARMELEGVDNATELKSLDFVVQETGHFQNFQWRHLGVLELAEPGIYSLRVLPVSISKAALMDVRAISLVRLPD